MAAAALPEDLILNILVRLPVKSLGRFRCVSKPWRTFINDPSFIRKHVDGISIENEYEIAILLIQFGLYGSRITSIRSMEIIEGGGFDHQHSDMNNPTMDLLIKDIDFPAETRSNWFKSSCDGILCTASSDSLLLWNPSIKEHKILPLSGPELCNSADEYGIGYDPSVDDYKVVRIPSAISLTVYSRSSIEIFTLKSNSWKKIPYNFPYPISQLSHGSFSNGAIYWVVRHALTMQTVIVCFHVMEEKFREVPLPDNGDNVFSSDSIFLQVLGGNLCLVHRAYDCFNIWAMKESWTKLTSSPLRVPGDDFKAVKVYCSPHIGILYVNKRTGEFGTYNLRDKTFRKLCNTGCSIADFHIAYVKTLVSPISC